LGSYWRRHRHHRTPRAQEPLDARDRRRVYLADISSLDCDLADPVWFATEVYHVIEWLLKKIVVHFPFRTITDSNGDPYLTRWYVWPKAPRTKGEADDAVTPNSPFAVFIHFFHRSDKDRDQHNHPWAKSWALILKGGYVEERGNASRTFKPGMVNVITKDDYHRVELLDAKKGSWSLFVAGKNVGSWGFRSTETGEHVHWRNYLGGDNTVR
jgi:hypothetical protein